VTNNQVFEFISRGGDEYRLTRFVILRVLGLVYAVAFLVAANQLVPLIGEHGLTPMGEILERFKGEAGSLWPGMVQAPSFFWFGISDRALTFVAWIGFALSLVVLAGYANAILMTVLWMMYMSIVHIGNIWYGYGWETQLLETGFLSIFLCPLLDPRPFPKQSPPLLVIWLFRWLGFRIMVGAGLIKMRGDSCWRELTCMYYHYETQPIPSPVSRYLHFAPHWFHNIETLWNHFIELVVPWFSFGPRLARHIAGALLITFQLLLIVSGNLSFLNYMTIIPFLACLDDTFWRRILPAFLTRRADRIDSEPALSSLQTGASIALTALVAFLSIQPVANLVSNRQAMNKSFDPLDLVNTYGAFGSVGEERHEIIFEGTSDIVPNESSQWKAYEFEAKPGDPNRAPPFIAPYQPRIDWQIWFAAMESPSQQSWTLHFIWRLLHNDPGTLSLLVNNPFPNEPPRYIRAQLYLYHFKPPGEPGWWTREFVSEWLPPLSIDDPEFRRVLTARHWLD
jgi:hypothetical protein